MEAERALGRLLPVCPVILHQRVLYGDALADGRSVEELDPESSASFEVRRLYRWALAFAAGETTGEVYTRGQVYA